jgi:hypothetical protein
MTKPIYEVTETGIKRINEDGSVSWIPIDEANSDYQRYLNPETDNPVGGN